MPDTPKTFAGTSFSLSEDEVAVVELYRALQLDRGEALRRLATPSSTPILPEPQELQSNFAAVAQDLTSADPAAKPPAR